MTDWYAAWVVRYAETFGISEERDVKTLLSWHAALGATELELNTALDTLARQPDRLTQSGGRYLAGGRMLAHLHALHAAVRDFRAIDARPGAVVKDDGMGTCDRCLSTGWVVVPHLKCVKDGEWVPAMVGGKPVTYTVAVVCNCALGRWVRDRQTGDHRSLGIEAYQHQNPDWRRQLRDREAQQLAMAAAEEAARGGDPRGKLDGLVAGLAERFGLEGVRDDDCPGPETDLGDAYEGELPAPGGVIPFFRNGGMHRV